MRKLLYFVAYFLTFLVFSCSGPFKEDLEETKARIEELRTLVDATNSTLNSVQHLVSYLESGSYITSVDPVNESGRQTAYKVNFLNGNCFQLILGVDGLDGYTPSFSVKRDSDGHYYWTLDGDWIKGSDGQHLRVDGLEQSDVIVPMIKMENGYWKISTDNGKSWSNLAAEKDIFYFQVISDVDTSSDTHVTFTLSDGIKLEVPRYIPISLSLGDVSEERVVAPGEVLTIPYKVEGTVTDGLVVTSGTDGIYTSEVNQRDAREGVIRVTCPQDYSDGYVFIMVHDGGYSAVKMISFSERKMDIKDGLSYRVDSSGGTVSVPFKSNFDFDLEFVDDTGEWVHYQKTRTFIVSGTMTFTVDANTSDAVRSGIIRIRPADNPDFIWATVSIIQASSYFSMDASLIQVGSDGGNYTIEMTSSRGVSISFAEGSDWVEASVASTKDFHTLSLKVGKNHSSEGRTATLLIYTKDRQTIQGRITVDQQAWNLDHYKDLVFQVRTNIANDWTIYLPIRGEMNCYVDWGDGNVEIIDKTTDRSNDNFSDWIFHEYDTLLPASYRVSVAGSVEALNGRNMPNKGGITAIEQWGDVGLRYMKYAFEGFPRLFSIPSDPIGGFKEVKDFGCAFKDCIYLTDIDKDLLAYAVKAESLNDLFQNCIRLQTIPGGLLRNCAEAKNLHAMFSDCHVLSDIPENLFWGCPKAEDFSGTFNSTGIMDIPERLFEKCPEVISFGGVFSLCPVNDPPEKLFANNPKVREFNRAFYYCQGIHSIPVKLFANNPEVTTFEGTFGQDYGLEKVPAGLFDNNKKVKDFGATFWDVRFETSVESPYTIINGKKVHLYERIDCPDHFVTPSYSASCFTDGWADSNIIPLEWK